MSAKLAVVSLLLLRQSPVVLPIGPMVFSPCVGIAAWPADASSTVNIRQCALVAMQEAQDVRFSAGAVRRYRQGSEEAHTRRNMLLRDLMSVTDSGQLALYFQPKLDVRTGCVASAEALMRWNHPTLGMVSPVEFISLAERMGGMPELTQWALAHAVRQMSRWQAQGMDLDLSANLSALDLQHRDLPDYVQQLLSEHQVSAGALTLEITETSAMHDSDDLRRVLGDLRDLGLTLSIDDFGTGYSSLALLQRLPLAELKIDQSFVRPLAQEDVSSGCAAIVRAATEMGHAMGLRVVCEGVETASVTRRLASWGVDALQGYWLSRPLPAEALQAWILSGKRPTMA